MLKKNGELILGIIVTALGPIVYLLSGTIRLRAQAGVGADFMPKVAALIFFITGIMQLKRGIRLSKKFEENDDGNVLDKPDYITAGLTLALLLLYVSLLEKVGFIITTAVYLFFQMLLLEKIKHNYVKLVIISVLCAVGIYFIFRNAFDIMIPAGILG